MNIFFLANIIFSWLFRSPALAHSFHNFALAHARYARTTITYNLMYAFVCLMRALFIFFFSCTIFHLTCIMLRIMSISQATGRKKNCIREEQKAGKHFAIIIRAGGVGDGADFEQKMFTRHTHARLRSAHTHTELATYSNDVRWHFSAASAKYTKLVLERDRRAAHTEAYLFKFAVI